jgi:hypothetical protein
MRQLQSLIASAVLTLALAATTAAGDGIIHTGLTPPPPPATTSSVTDETPSEGEATEGETTALDLVVEAALNCLQGALTLF